MREVVHEEHRSRSGHWWFRARRRIFGRLIDDLVGLPPGARLLELGPGHGVNVGELGSRGHLTVLDTDVSSLEASRAAGAPGAVSADASRLPFRSGHFDLVCAFDVIEHLDDDDAALRECRRVLRPGGALFISVPALPLLWGRQDVLAEHRRRYTRRLLRERVEAAGLSIERLTFFNTLLFPPIAAVRLLMRPLLPWTSEGGKSDLGMGSPGVLSALLEGVFASEAGWITRRNLPVGVSLLCLCRPVDPGP